MLAVSKQTVIVWLPLPNDSAILDNGTLLNVCKHVIGRELSSPIHARLWYKPRVESGHLYNLWLSKKDMTSIVDSHRILQSLTR